MESSGRVMFAEQCRTLEDFLATDDLFVEYFNAYLALPTFPDPLCFNPESGGFEVVSEARKEVTQQIKAALRSQRRTPRMYRVARQHAFVPIPLIPIIPAEGPEKMEIDTSFSVTTLNKEQGIHWVKAERLPTFLRSDLYHEYRLGHVLSQVKVTDSRGHFVLCKLDFTPRPVKKKSENEEKKVDVKEVYMKQMYVCMGQTSTTTTDTWFSQAREAHDTTTPTYLSLSRPVSASRPLAEPRPASCRSALANRPASASVRASSWLTRPDSGVSSTGGGGGPAKSSVFSSSFFGSLDSMPLDDVTDHAARGDVSKPYTPRPSEPVCVTTTGMEEGGSSRVVYVEPKEDSSSSSQDSESGVGDISETDNPADQDDRLEDALIPDHPELGAREKEEERLEEKSSGGGESRGESAGRRETGGGDGGMSVEDLSGVIVGVVLKKAVKDLGLVGVSDDDVDKDPRFAFFFPHERYSKVSFEELDNLSAIADSTPPASETSHDSPPPPPPPSPPPVTDTTTATTTTDNEDDHSKEITTDVKTSTKGKANDNESDVDSLLDSEEDYEEEDVEFFRRHKRQRSHGLGARKGLEYFKRFLKGTAGECLWSLWIDIDRLPLLTSQEDRVQYLSGMRDKYHKQGAPYEISSELKTSLGLREPGHWTVPRLQALQSWVAEPLVTYWGPRYLLKELLRTRPARYRQYQEQRLSLMPPREVCPDLPTPALLPLRPKSCRPRMQHGGADVTRVESMWQRTSPPPPEEVVHVKELTTPPVGMKRVHGPPAVKVPESHTPAKAAAPTNGVQLAAKPPSGSSRGDGWGVAKRKKPRELLKAHLRTHDQHTRKERSAATPSATTLPGPDKPPSAKARPKSAKPPSLSDPSCPQQPKSSASLSSDTWENASSTSSVPPTQARITTSKPPVRVAAEGSRSRPKTAPAQRKSSLTGSCSSSSSSVFEGGRRMEALLQALYHEKDSGHFFRAFLKKTDNKRWVDSAQFWEDLQEYRTLFYQESIDPFVVKKRAQAIYSKYIVSASPKDIGCSAHVRRGVYGRLTPPQEELFDQAEEEALRTLYTAWLAGLSADMHTYDKVELVEVKRHLETKNQFVLNLQRSGLIKERPVTPEAETPVEGYEDPVYDPALWEPVPEEFRDYTLDKLVHNRIELEHFKQFLAEKYADIDLKCWMDIEAWRRISPTDERKRDQKAKDIKKAFLNKKYFFGPNSPAGKEGQEKVMQAGGGWGKLLEDRPPNPVLLESQQYVRARLEQKWLPVFLATEAFVDRQRPKANMDDVVDDVLVQKRRRSQAVWKMLESKWLSSSKEILTFRRALMNPVTSHQFRRFVSIKGENLENNVLFWQEVQKYKLMHHVHTEDSLLSQKISAIIHCFLDSAIPPTVQLDIPHEMAERVLDRKHEKCPYLFREAQLAVFRILFSQWNDFCDLRSNLGHDKVLPTIEKLRRHARVKDRRRQVEMERKAEEERLRETGLTPGGGVDALFHDPFADHESQEDEVGSQSHKGGRIEFSYAAYFSELHKEDLVNNTDESLFSSLADLTVWYCVHKEDLVNNTDEGLFSSLADLTGGSSKDLSQRNGHSPHQQTSSTPTNDRKASSVSVTASLRRHSRPEQTQATTNTLAPVTANPRRKSVKRESLIPERPPSAAAEQPRAHGGDGDGRRDSTAKPTTTTTTTTTHSATATTTTHSATATTITSTTTTPSSPHRPHHPAISVSLHNSHASDVKLARHIPPLTQKR
ncbi:hypothetical protein ACOMHN_019546 [Nucella lapillus]